MISPYPTDMVKIGPVCLEKKMLTQEDGRKR